MTIYTVGDRMKVEQNKHQNFFSLSPNTKKPPLKITPLFIITYGSPTNKDRPKLFKKPFTGNI